MALVENLQGLIAVKHTVLSFRNWPVLAICSGGSSRALVSSCHKILVSLALFPSSSLRLSVAPSKLKIQKSVFNLVVKLNFFNALSLLALQDERLFVNNITVRFHQTLELEEDEIKTIICRYPPPAAPIPVIPLIPM